MQGLYLCGCEFQALWYLKFEVEFPIVVTCKIKNFELQGLYWLCPQGGNLSMILFSRQTLSLGQTFSLSLHFYCHVMDQSWSSHVLAL